MFLEPVLISPSTNIISNWYHPEIEDIINKFEKKKNVSNGSNVEYYQGPVVGFHARFDNGLSVKIAVVTNESGIKSISQLKQETHFVRKLASIFESKEWSPGNNTFRTSDYGIIFNNLFSLSTQHFNLDIFKEITLTTNGNEWWFF